MFLQQYTFFPFFEALQDIQKCLRQHTTFVMEAKFSVQAKWRPDFQVLIIFQKQLFL